ncbi:hypothetical protein I4U23_030725 [Adineta vaga]|nr:hypothetical protein I4U23_030725 [Adineta vaga]
MYNVTTEISVTVNIFRRYLLGESLKNSLIRLTVILSAILLVWVGMIFALIIHLKCQRSRQILKSSTSHHLYDNEHDSIRKRSEQLVRNRRFDSSVSSISSTRCYSIRRIFIRLKRCCIFWPSVANANDDSEKRSSISSKQRDTIRMNSCTVPPKIQIMIENTVKRPSTNVGRKLSSYYEGDSSSSEELKTLCSSENNREIQIEINRKSSNVTELVQPKSYLEQPSLSLPVDQANRVCPSTEQLQKLHEFNTKATLLFHPITRRLSNANADSCLPPINTIQMQQRKSLFVVSSARELTSVNKWKWKHSLVNDPIIRDERITSSARQLPLVMITDTSSSNTNIVELETYEDNHRLMTDIEKRLAHQLRSSYRPRHST